MRIRDARCIISGLGLLAGLLMSGYLAPWIAAVLFAPD